MVYNRTLYKADKYKLLHHLTPYNFFRRDAKARATLRLEYCFTISFLSWLLKLPACHCSYHAFMIWENSSSSFAIVPVPVRVTTSSITSASPGAINTLLPEAIKSKSFVVYIPL